MVERFSADSRHGPIALVAAVACSVVGQTLCQDARQFHPRLPAPRCDAQTCGEAERAPAAQRAVDIRSTPDGLCAALGRESCVDEWTLRRCPVMCGVCHCASESHGRQTLESSTGRENPTPLTHIHIVEPELNRSFEQAPTSRTAKTLNVYYLTSHHSVGADFEYCIRLAAEGLNVSANVTSCNLGPR